MTKIFNIKNFNGPTYILHEIQKGFWYNTHHWDSNRGLTIEKLSIALPLGIPAALLVKICLTYPANNNWCENSMSV